MRGNVTTTAANEEVEATTDGMDRSGIEVVAASPDEAMVLDVAAGAPLLSITRTTTDTDDEPIEFSHDLFRADRTRIVVRTPGQGGVARASRGRGRVIELRSQAVM